MRSLMTRTRVALSIVVLGSLAAACGGGGSSTVTGAPAPAAPAASRSKATFVIVWPKTSPVANKRRPAYISPSTANITISVNGGPATAVPNPNSFTTPDNTPSTTVSVDAPVGADTFAVDDFDSTGKLLASNSIPFTIVKDSANVIPVTLNGNLAQIACAAVGPFVTSTGSGAALAFTEVGPAGQLSLQPEDADGNVIIAPGNVPAVALAAADATMGNATASTTPNLYTLNTLKVGTAVVYNATGTNAAGTTVTTACNVTRVLAMYVTNHYNNEVGGSAGSTAPQSASVVIYPASATGSATPTATIAGDQTMLAGVQFLAVDAKGDVFVTNQGPQPGATFGPTSGSVTIYPPLSNGNVAPVGTIPNINIPEGIAFDKNGKLYVLSVDRINEYLPATNGATAAAVVDSAIAGPDTDLFSCYGLAVATDLTVYSACSNVANGYAANATGDAKPGVILVAGATAMTFASDSWLGVSVDPAGNIALADSNNNSNSIETYTESQVPPPGSSGTPLPVMNPGTGLSEPYGIANDINGQYYVANYGSNSIETFTSITTLQAGTGTNLPLTGLFSPYGIAVI